MEDLKYQDKYIKYKNKYLKLKAYEKQLTTTNNKQNQTGGNYFYAGTYVFFLNKYHLENNEIKNYINNRKIDNFDNFTNILGNCAYFLRLGTTLTGKDFAHTYDTIYPNNSVYGSVQRSIVESVMSIFQTNNKPIINEDEQNNQAGGVVSAPFEIKYICHYKPIRLNDISNISNFSTGFFYHEDIENKENLKAIVKGINDRIFTQYGNEVTTVLIIEKFANTNPRAEILKKYTVKNDISGDKYKGVTDITEITK